MQRITYFVVLQPLMTLDEESTDIGDQGEL